MFSVAQKLVLRCKPCKEEKAWHIEDDRQTLVGESQEDRFKVDRILGESASHAELYSESLSEWVEDVLNGHNMTMLVYGLPYTGKTHTVMGTAGQSRVNSEARGIIVRCMEQLIEVNLKRKEAVASVTGSFYHVYNDGRVADLLDTKKRNMKVTELSNGIYFIPEAAQQPLSSVQDVVKLVEKAHLMRNATGTVKTNKYLQINQPANPLQQYRPHSTHAVFQYNIEFMNSSKDLQTSQIVASHITIVDLAGHCIQTHYNDPSTCDDVGLAALHETLTEVSSGNIQKGSEVCLSSPLTQLLYPSFFGNCRTVLVATVPMDKTNSATVKKCLQFCQTFKFCKNCSSPVTVPSLSTSLGKNMAIIEQLKKTIAQECGADANSVLEVTSSSSVMIDDKKYDKLTTTCQEMVSKLQQIEAQMLSKSTSPAVMTKNESLNIPDLPVNKKVEKINDKEQKPDKPVFPINNTPAIPVNDRGQTPVHPVNNTSQKPVLPTDQKPTEQITFSKTDISQNLPKLTLQKPNNITEKMVRPITLLPITPSKKTSSPQALMSTNKTSNEKTATVVLSSSDDESSSESEIETVKPLQYPPPPLKDIPHSLPSPSHEPSILGLEKSPQDVNKEPETNDIVKSILLRGTVDKETDTKTNLQSHSVSINKTSQNHRTASSKVIQVIPSIPPTSPVSAIATAAGKECEKSLNHVSLPLPSASTGDENIKKRVSNSSLSSSSSSQPSQDKKKQKRRRKKSENSKRTMKSVNRPWSPTKQLIKPLSNTPQHGPAEDVYITTSNDSDTDEESRDTFDPNFKPGRLTLQPQFRQVRALQPLNFNPIIRESDLTPQANMPHQFLPPIPYPQQQTPPKLPGYYDNQASSVYLTGVRQLDEHNRVPLRRDNQYLSNHEIHLCAMEGVKSSYMKKLVMKYGVDHRDHGGRTPLMYAVLGNQPKTCELLIQMEADINLMDDSHHTALLWAVYQAKPEVTKVLLKNGANVHMCDPQNRSVFHWAMKTPNIACLKNLSKYATFGIENKPDNEGVVPLHWAVMCEQPQHIQILLNSVPSSEVNSQDLKGRTPLNYAVLTYSPICIKAILDCHPLAVNFKDSKGRTPLHYACAESSADCVRALLACKSCDLQATDNLGTTPLHWASAANQPGIVQLLLRRGADRGQRDNNNEKPSDHAHKRGHFECVKILENYGLQRPSSAWSIASQFSIHPPTPPELDQHGHIPMRRPPQQSHFSFSTGNSLTSLDRLPADGEEEPAEQTPTTEETRGGTVTADRNSCNDEIQQMTAEQQTMNISWRHTLVQWFRSCAGVTNIVAPTAGNDDNNH